MNDRLSRSEIKDEFVAKKENAGQKAALAPTSERLMAGAAELFRKKGYAGTSTRELSALIGVQSASLYHHMGGKEDLLYRLCISTLQDVAEVFEAAKDSSSDPLTVLDTMAHEYVKISLRDRDRHATMLAELRALSDARRAEVIALRDNNVKTVVEIIAAAQRKTQLRKDIAPKYLALALFNLLNWSIFWYSPDGQLSPEKISDMLWSVFSQGVVLAVKDARPRA
jgi:AcrR family transcriptional regulator